MKHALTILTLAAVLLVNLNATTPAFDIVADKQNRTFRLNDWTRFPAADYFGNGILLQANSNFTGVLAYTEGEDIRVLTQTTSTPMAVDGDSAFYTKMAGTTWSLHRLKSDESSSVLISDVSALGKSTGLASINGLAAGGGKALFNLQQGPSSGVDYFAHLLWENDETQVIAETGMAVPGMPGETFFQLTQTFSINTTGDLAAFYFELGDLGPDYIQGICKWEGTGLQTILKLGDPLPGGSVAISDLRPQTWVLGDSVYTFAFGQGGEDRALLRWKDGSWSRVLDQSHPDLGVRINSLGFQVAGPYLYIVQSGYDVPTSGYRVEVWRYDPQTDAITQVLEPGFSVGDTPIQSINILGRAATGDDFLLFAQHFNDYFGLLTTTDINNTQSIVSGEPASYWSDVAGTSDGSKLTGIGWINDALWPFIYHFGNASWLYILELPGSSKDGFYAYHYGRDSWIWTGDTQGGYFYDFNAQNWFMF